MNPSEENTHSQGNKATSLRYREGRARQTHPWCWDQNDTHNPPSVPGAGFRNRDLSFPWSVAPRRHLGSLVPEPPLCTTRNRRPNFWHYRGHGAKMRAKGSQTECDQPWHSGVSQGSWESGGALCNPPEGEAPSLDKRGDEEAERDSWPQGDVPSAAPTARSDRVDEAIQCDGSRWGDAELEGSPGSSPEGRRATGADSVLCGDLGGEDMGGPDREPPGDVTSSAPRAQSHRVDEAIQCDGSWLVDAERVSPAEQTPEASEEPAPDCTSVGARRTPRNRKSDEGVVVVFKRKNDVESLNKEVAAMNMSGGSESEDEAWEVEWLLEEEVSGPSSRERAEQEGSWASYFYSRLVWWPRSNKGNDKKEAEGEDIPLSMPPSSKERTVTSMATSL